MAIKNLSVFFPVYNEEGNITVTVNKALAVLEKLNLKDYEVSIVDDGSTDGTGKVSDDLAGKNPKIRVIHHPKNLGYGEALKSGFYNAKYEVIVYTDGDGQFDFAEVTKFLEKIEDHDLVIGYRIKRQDPLFRILFKQGWMLTLLLFFRLTLKDVDCGFKMVRKKVLEKIPHLESSRGAMINAELAIKTKKAHFKTAQVGVNHFARLSGKPTGANINVIFKSYLDLVKLWWYLKTDKLIFILILATLVLAAFLRFYKLDQYMIFLGDEGRDALIVKAIVTGNHFPLIGPPTSVGNIYLGSLYYYMMAVPMSIFYLNPAAASGMVAFIGVLTVGFIYYLGKIWFGKKAGLIAAFLYAISPVTIYYSRFSWNPNPLPFFSLAVIFGLYKMHQSRNFLWLVLTGAALAAAAQMHYLALILIPIAGILWIIELLQKNDKKPAKNIVLGTISGIIVFLLMMSPLLFFDLRHDWLNLRAINQLFTQSQAFQGNIISNISKPPTIYLDKLIGRYMTGENFYLTVIVSLLVIVALIVNWGWIAMALAVWLFVGIFILSFYQQSIYDHYLGFLNPVPFLLIGSLSAIRIPKLKMNKWLINTGLVTLMVILAAVNLQENPLRNPPNNQLQNTQNIARFIIARSQNQPFNFALISKNNYDSAYQFYLDVYGYKPKQLPFEKTSQLFVVCEDSVCDPTHNPKYEVAGFGWSKIDWQQNQCGVNIYRLVANPSGKP